MTTMRKDAQKIIDESIEAVLPEAAVGTALEQIRFQGDVVLVAIGKAAWNMARAAKDKLGERIQQGIVLTKYDHSKGVIEDCEIIEAGHPLPDENSFKGATKILDLVSSISANQEVLFLVSGGGSALFEKPLNGVSLKEMIDVTDQLLNCGANIVEINTVRKHLSAVKGGRFAEQCKSAMIHAIVLSDVVGDRLDAIASGPAYPDSSTSADARKVIEKYGLQLSDNLFAALEQETPKTIDNCKTIITGSVSALCEAAAKSVQAIGYKPVILSTSIENEAKEVGTMMAAIAKEIKKDDASNYSFQLPCAVILGGETVVHIQGEGKGGRNQEVALAAAIGIEDLKDVVIFSVGSDGTDGPTDAAGGLVDGESVKRMQDKSLNPAQYLADNDSFHALSASDDLVKTGPTGTNVNDLMVILCR